MIDILTDEHRALLALSQAEPGTPEMFEYIDAAANAVPGLIAEVGRLRGALPDPALLELLADWIDSKYPDDSCPEVQTDLRLFAQRARAALRPAPEAREKQ